MKLVYEGLFKKEYDEMLDKGGYTARNNINLYPWLHRYCRAIFEPIFLVDICSYHRKLPLDRFQYFRYSKMHCFEPDIPN